MMGGRYIKDKTVNIVQGCCRLLVFFIAIGPFFDCLNEEGHHSLSMTNEKGSPTASIGAFWKMIEKGIELIICFIVMADCIVIDSISYEDAAMNQTFLHLFKLHPIFLRGLLYLVISGIENSTDLRSYYDTDKKAPFAIWIALDIGRKILIIPAVVQIVVSCFRYRKQVIDIQPGSPTDDPVKQRISKFWMLTRYYEMEEYKSKDRIQTIKQRIGRACLVVPVLFSLVSGGLSAFIKYKVLNVSIQNTSGTFVFNNINVSNKTEISSFQNLFRTQIFVPYVSHSLLSLLFVVFIFVCITRPKFVRLHNAFKVLIFYNCLSSMVPIKMLTTYVSVYKKDMSLESVLWLSVLLPFLFALPVLFYLFTHYPYKHVGDVVNGFKDFYQVLSNLRNPTKLHKCVNTLMIICGLSGLFLLILAVNHPWMTVVFNPNKELKQLARSYDSIFEALKGLQTSGFIQFKTGLTKLKPMFKTPLLTKKFHFKVDIHEIVFLLPCFLFGTVCCTIGFWRRHSVQRVSTRFILSTIAFSFFVSNVVVGFLILSFKSLLLLLLRLIPLVDPSVSEENGWMMMKLAFALSSIAALLLWLRTTGGFIISLFKLMISKCLARRKVKYDKHKHEMYENGGINYRSNDEISVISASDTLSVTDNRSEERKCHFEPSTPRPKFSIDIPQPQQVKSKLSSPTAWVMALFPALVSGIIILYIIAERPSLFIATPEVTGFLRSLLTETFLKSDKLSPDNLLFKRDVSYNQDEASLFNSLGHDFVKASRNRIFKRQVPDIKQNISIFKSGLEVAFLSDKLIDIGGFLYVLNLAMPILCTFFVFLGFGLVSCRCFNIKQKKKIAGTLVFWMLRLIIASLSFSQSIMGLIRLVFNNVPFFRLNLKEGPAVHLVTVVNVVLLLSWIELRISKCKPLL